MKVFEKGKNKKFLHFDRYYVVCILFRWAGIGITLQYPPNQIASPDCSLVRVTSLEKIYLFLNVFRVAQTFIQLVLLSVIMVAQNIAGDAADLRADKVFKILPHLIKFLSILCEYFNSTCIQSLEDVEAILSEVVFKYFLEQ